MSLLYVILATTLLLGSSLADPSLHADTQSEAEVESVGEGRNCIGNCGSGTGYHHDNNDHHDHLGHHGSTTTTYGHYDLGGFGGLLGGAVHGAVGLPLLAVNIAILILLGILLAHVKHIGYGETGTGDVYHYSAPVPAYVGGSAGSSYQGYDTVPSGGYHKRSTEDARSMQSPTMVSYLTKMVANAITKYAEVEKEE